MIIRELLNKNLTSDQYKAAVDPAKEVLCLACAGSGKSRTLAYRIVRLLAEGDSPEGIVAFTFTNKAAESIKRRIAEALEKAGFDATTMGAMYIGTIHSYCQRFLEEMNPVNRQFEVLDENRLKLYLMSRFFELNLNNIQTRVKAKYKYFRTIKQISDAWKTANDELLDFDEISNEDSDLGQLFSHIKGKLRADQYIDFSLMIRNVVEMIQSKALRVKNDIRLPHHLLVDEYQDVNPCQEKLIRLLCERCESLFVVGDDDQAIYAWRGANVENILSFSQTHPLAKTHVLSQNFRSTKPIIRVSNNFARAELAACRITKKPFPYKNRTPQDFRVLRFIDRNSEAQWIAERIQSLLGTAYDDNSDNQDKRGLTPADFAVLMRSTRQKEKNGDPRHGAFTKALAKLKIPFSLEAGGSPFDYPEVAVLRATFGLLREESPSREAVQEHFEKEVSPQYPKADFRTLARTLTHWGRKIHRPQSPTGDFARIRLYPQELVYDLLEAFNISRTPDISNDVMRGIGLFSRMIQDVETVYMSVDTKKRFVTMLNFLERSAEAGYDISTDDLLQRPDAVTVSTVHKMKGLEFPCVFVVDVEERRFPKSKKKYMGWLPKNVMAGAIERGAYQSTPDEEARLFYTAMTRAERYLYVTSAKALPSQDKKRSSYACRIALDPEVIQKFDGLPAGLVLADPRQRSEAVTYPTTFSEIRSFLQCPKSYQFRERFGFKPMIPATFGYGKTVHTSIEKLHELYPDSLPDNDQIKKVVEDTFHLKHVPKSREPEKRPGLYEVAQKQTVAIAQKYVAAYGSDFKRKRQIEARFEIPAAGCVISGSIDLLLHEDKKRNIVRAEIIEFKTMKSDKQPDANIEQPDANNDLDWTELALQVQLYARAANQVLGQNTRAGSVHFLKDNQRVDVPITQEACDAALSNIEWAVKGILNSDFPMRPHLEKCGNCDFEKICSKTPESFKQVDQPPELHLPGRREMARAFSLYDGG